MIWSAARDRHAKAQAVQDRGRLIGWDLGAGEAVQPLEMQGRVAAPGGLGAGARGLGRLAAAEFEDHGGGGVERFRQEIGVDAAFEPGAGIAVDLVAAPGECHAHRIEQRAFDEHAGGGFADRGGFAAHDAGQRNHAGGVGDDDILVRHVIALVIQRAERLAAVAAADGERAAGDLVGVENMQRTAEVVGEEVGQVHERADRAEADRRQAPGEPIR